MPRSLLRRVKGKLVGKAPPRFLRDVYPDADIGAHSYGGLQVIGFGDNTTYSVGKYCSFAADVRLLLGGGHRLDWVTTYPFSEIDPEFAHIEGHPASKGDIHIGNDVWVGREAMILSGVTIGDGAVIAARSVVTRDVKPYSIVGGQPAKPIKSRFSQSIIDRLLELRWWNWPEERVRKAVPLMLQPDIEDFLTAAENGEI